MKPKDNSIDMLHKPRTALDNSKFGKQQIEDVTINSRKKIIIIEYTEIDVNEMHQLT